MPAVGFIKVGKRIRVRVKCIVSFPSRVYGYVLVHGRKERWIFIYALRREGGRNERGRVEGEWREGEWKEGEWREFGDC